MEFKLATLSEAHTYRGKAFYWFDVMNPGDMFVDCKSVAIGAIAEYLANQDGITLFDSKCDEASKIDQN